MISVRFGSARTEDYRIASGGPTGVGSRYEVLLDTPFGEDANFLGDVPDGAQVNINVFKEVKENKPEFQGRFFVKINRDFAFEENVIKPFDAMNKIYGVLGEQRINVFKQSTNTEGNGNKFGWNYQDPGEDDDPWFECCGDNFNKEKVMGFGAWGGNGVWKSENTKAWYNPPTNGESSFGFGCAGVSGSSYLGPLAGDVGQSNGLMQPGVLVRFVDRRNGDKSNVYGVKDVEAYRSRRWKMRTCGWFPCTNCCPDSDNGNHMYSISVILDSALGPNGNIDFFAKFNGDRNSLDKDFG